MRLAVAMLGRDVGNAGKGCVWGDTDILLLLCSGGLNAAGRSGYGAWLLPTPGCLRGFILQLGTGRSIYPSWTVASQFGDLVCETSPSQQPKGRVHGFEDENLFSLNVDLFCWCGFSSPRVGECAGFGIGLAAGCSGFLPRHGLSWHAPGSCLVAPLALGSLFLIFLAAWKVSGCRENERSEVPCVTQLLCSEFSSLPL